MLNEAGVSGMPILDYPFSSSFVSPQRDARIAINGKIGNHQRCVSAIDGTIANTPRSIRVVVDGYNRRSTYIPNAN